MGCKCGRLNDLSEVARSTTDNELYEQVKQVGQYYMVSSRVIKDDWQRLKG